MPQHFTRNTVSAPFWCGRCSKVTQHRIDKGRKGPCLNCIARYDNAPKPEKPPSLLAKPEAQRSLFAAEIA